MNAYDYIDSGFKVFGLHGADTNGVCGCGNPECKALFKHPVINNWQRIPHWSDEQLETMEEMGHFRTGFGVLCDGYIVVDVDPRNGGDITKLDIDISQTFTVQTGGGGLHVYYKAPAGVSLISHHPDHPGIDFKSSGFVVGAGSIHASGSIYESLYGHPDAIQDAPEFLVGLLRRPAFFRAETSAGAVDVTLDEIAAMLSHVDPDSPYDEWVKVGMAIHHATSGSGFDIWDDWSRRGKKYTGVSALEKHWHSFGKSANPAGLGTLIFYAERGGYQKSVEFVSDAFFEADNSLDVLDDIDLNSPPGFLGEVVRWVNGQCLYPLSSLSVAVSLIGVAGLSQGRYIDEKDGITSNLMVFCTAGSGTGKESVQKALTAILQAGGQEKNMYGGLKSEQELIRNLVRCSSSTYCIDEFGIILGKITNAKKSGAHYLEGLIAAIMSIYSKADSFYLPTGDMKTDMEKHIKDQIASTNQQLEKTGKQELRAVIEALEEKLRQSANGIANPFLCVAGFSTPVTFDELMTQELATNGFMSRAISFQELETNPKRKENFKKEPMPMALQMTLAALADTNGKINIPTDAEGAAVLDDVYHAFYEMAEAEKGRSGLEAICRRGYEIAAKVSMILAIPGGVRTAQHVRWAFALAKRDIEAKIKLAYSNMTEKRDPMDALAVRITKLVSEDHGETRAVIANRCSNVPKANVNKMIDTLIERGIVFEKPDENSNRKTLKIYLTWRSK